MENVSIEDLIRKEKQIIEEKLLEIESFEDEGLISSPNGKIDLQEIVSTTQNYFQDIREEFGELRQEVFSNILDFANNVYMVFFDLDFVEKKPNRSSKYIPGDFLEAAYRLSFEMSDGGKIRDFYDSLAINFDQSNRFIYHLVVKDLSFILSKVKQQGNYSKETFTSFALEILDQAKNYSIGKVKDKWIVFEELFDNSKNRYFPDLNNYNPPQNQNGNNFGIDYITALVRKRPKKHENELIKLAEEYSERVGTIIGVDFQSKRERDNARINIYTPDGKLLKIVITSKRRTSNDVKEFILGITDITLKNLIGSDKADAYFGMTIRAKKNIKFYL